MKRNKFQYEVVVRGDFRFVLQIFPITENFQQAYEAAQQFVEQCKSMTTETLRIASVREFKFK